MQAQPKEMIIFFLLGPSQICKISQLYLYCNTHILKMFIYFLLNLSINSGKDWDLNQYILKNILGRHIQWD